MSCKPTVSSWLIVVVCLIALITAEGCSSSTSSNGGNSRSSDERSSVAQAKEHLLAVSRQMDGPLFQATESLVKQREQGGLSWAILDEEFSRDFSTETREAYRAWRSASIAEGK